MELLVKTNGFLGVKFHEISSSKKDFWVDKKKDPDLPDSAKRN
jgi:hypothetical protein